MQSTAAWKAVGRSIAAALVVFAAAPLALADSVTAIEPGSDTVTGTSLPSDAPRLLPVRLYQGAPFSVEVKADRGSLFRPIVALYGADRQVDASAVFILDAKGVKASLKNYLPKSTGIHWIEVKAAEGSSGPWTLKSKVKYPKGLAGSGELMAGGEPVEFSFTGPGRAVATITVTGLPKESGAPGFDAIRETGGPAMDPGVLKVTKTGFSLKGVALPKQAGYSLFVDPAPGGAGTFSVKIAWKVTPAAKRVLPASSVVAEPVLVAIDPEGGNQTQSVAVTLGVIFARPGATVEFRSGPTVVTVPAGSITLEPGAAKFGLNLGNFPHGVYDVAFLNSDGGSSVLREAFTVTAVSPSPASVSPASAYRGAVRRLRISGTLFHGNAAFALRKGPTTIPGTVVGSGAGYRDADFDLATAAMGAWDVVVTNPGAAPATLSGAFTVLEVITLTSMSPADNKGADVVDAVIGGGGFVSGATAVLRRTVGEEVVEIAGTDVETVSSSEIHAVFDTTGAAPGLWNLVLSFPTGETRTLTGCFRTRITGGGGDPVQPFSASQQADGPPAVAYNDLTGETMIAWVEEDPSGIVLAWYLYARLLDAQGNPVGDPVLVSDDGGTMEKRSAVAGYDPVNDEFLVVWTEKATVTPTQVKGFTHPNGTSAVALFQVLAQRLAPSDLAKTGSNVLVTDATGYNRNGNKPTWYLGDFNAYRPSLVFDGKNGAWEIAWMGEFDTQGTYSTDDYDVFQRSFDAKSGSLGALTLVASTDAHEGDPSLAFDADSGTTVLAYNARPDAKGGDLDLWFGANGAYSMILAGGGNDLGDPAVAVDTASKTAVVTWTRAVSDGTRGVEAAAVAMSDLTAVVGSVQTLATGGYDFLARPVANLDLGIVQIFWTRQDGKGTSSVMRRDADASSGTDLVLAEEEVEHSSGSGDEGLAAVTYAAETGETIVAWLGKITATGNPTYLGDVVPGGILRGVDLWFQRLR